MKKMHERPLDFAALALDCKAALGLAITDKPLVDNAIIRTGAGVALGLGF